MVPAVKRVFSLSKDRVSRIDFRFTIDDEELATRFRNYVETHWDGRKGSYSLVLRRALREFLDREEG